MVSRASFFVPVILVGAAGFYGDSISGQLAAWGSGCWPSPLDWWAFLSYRHRKARRVGVGAGAVEFLGQTGPRREEAWV